VKLKKVGKKVNEVKFSKKISNNGRSGKFDDFSTIHNERYYEV
jgi:hypothetical protein